MADGGPQFFRGNRCRAGVFWGNRPKFILTGCCRACRFVSLFSATSLRFFYSYRSVRPRFSLRNGAFLILKKWARWEIVLLFLAGAVAASLWLNAKEGAGFDPEILLLGAFFLVPDNATSPMTKTGRLLFGFANGVLVTLWGQRIGTREALIYSLLIMNALVPLLDSAFRPRRLPNGRARRPKHSR